MTEYQKAEHDVPPLTRKERLVLFSPLRLVLVLVLCIFTVEFMVMVLLYNMPRLTPITEFSLDAFLLSVVLCPILFFLLFQPLKHMIAQYQLSEHQLQRSNTELFQAYDATIEGWSRALELRDNGTDGHTRRTAVLTVKLARLFGLSEAELVQVRWGALLHDIGKMGIPDEILLKKDTLTEAEWVVMKKHTVFACEMLTPIRYLSAALDIPCAHHEKWDGTGYPLGLKGEQIPLVARIFAVADVWDSLRSDRHYHTSWSMEKVREHLRSLAGTHFDPHVVQVCLDSDVLVD